MPYISVDQSLKMDFSAHSFSEPFTENSFYAGVQWCWRYNWYSIWNL